MSFVACVEAKVEEGSIDKKRAEVALERYEELKDGHPANPDLDPSVEKEVVEELQKGIEDSVAESEYRVLHDAYKINQVLNDLEKLDGRYSNSIDDLGEAAIALVSKDFGKISDIDSVEQIQDAFKRQYNGYISSFYKAINEASGEGEQKVVGEKMLRAYLDDADVGDFHKKMADEFEKLFKVIAEDYKLRGGSLNRRDNYFPNPIHAKEALENAEFDGFTRKKAWVEYMKRGNNGEGFLDREKMVDMDTGRPLPDHAPEGEKSLYGPQGDDENFGLLGEVFDSITRTTDPEEELGTYRQKAFRKKHNDSRVLHFKDADSWMKYNQRFGSGNIANAVEAYVEKMAQDIAALERFGSRPERTKRIITDFIQKKADDLKAKEGVDGNVMENKAENNINSFEENWNMYFNTNMASPNWQAQGLAMTKQLTTSATIGSATISAVAGDTGNTAFTAWFNSMPVARMAMGGVKTFTEDISQKFLRQVGLWEGKTASEVKQQQALEAGLTARAILDESVGYARFLQKQEGHRYTKWMADKSMKWSGLNLFTRTGRAAFQIETGKYLARLANNTKWKNLEEVTNRLVGRDGGFVQMLERYDIGQKEWELLRQAEFKEESAGGFAGKTGKAFEWFRPIDLEGENMAKKTGFAKRELREVANKFRRMMATEEGHAVPTINNRSRAIIGEMQDANTFMGLIGRAGAQYKSFPLTQFTNNFSRAMMGKNQVGTSRLATMSAYMMFMVPLGGMAIQFREMTKGNDPMNVDPSENPTFWMDALSASGGLSIFGDVLMRGRDSDFSFMNNQIANVASGPTYGFLDSMTDIALDNSFRAADPDREMQLGKDTADFARQWMPFSNIWYSRLATDRLLFDTIEEMADPKAKRRFRNEYRKQIRKDNQGSFSPPGSGLEFLTEGDAPDLGDMFGGENDG